MHPYFAGHGYASIRVDLRGSGNSDGVLQDEYLETELRDGEEVIRWIASQPWCSGSVGMIGISWGGFNGLQLAARGIPELGAIITVCSTDDRYADDVHYMGGCLLSDNLSWASTMFAYNSCPPDPAVVGDRWREMWLERLEHSGLWLDTWLRHQRRDAYWEHGSVCEDFSAVSCPVFAVSGWADGYSNAVFRLLQGLSVPRKGLIGPWGHKYPHMAQPGPAMGFLQEATRWWDHWLAGVDRGLEQEPMLRVWMQDAITPNEGDTYRPGRWVAESSWPSGRMKPYAYRLRPWGLSPENPGDGDSTADSDRHAVSPTRSTDQSEIESLSIRSPLSVGLFAGKWTSYSAGTDLPSDQREEDGGALVFETEPLDEPFELLGAPTVEVELSVDKPVAMLACRLSDVGEQQAVTRVTYGLLNLTHTESHAEPAPLEPGRRYRVELRMNEIAQTFRAGHSIRLSISTSYWPLAWPPPEPVQLTLFLAGSRLVLPGRPQRHEDRQLRPFPQAEGAPPVPKTLLAPVQREWTVCHDLATNESTLKVVDDEGRRRLEDVDLELERKQTELYSYRNNRYESLRGEVIGERGFRRGTWQVRTVTRTVLTSSATHFRIRADLDAYEGDARIYSKSWDREIPRDHV
jgi:hypothetical protein